MIRCALLVPFSNIMCRLSISKPTVVKNKFVALGKNSQINIIAPYTQGMSSPVSPDMVLNYQDIVQRTEDNSIILIDVREPKELQENGTLPASVNIPLNDLKNALQSSSEEFLNKYGIPLPDKDSPLVFSCFAGGRSMKALLMAQDLGFKNAKHYSGGFSDWIKNAASQ